MSELVAKAADARRNPWLKDVAALASIGAFVWVAGTWAEIARSLLQI